MFGATRFLLRAFRLCVSRSHCSHSSHSSVRLTDRFLNVPGRRFRPHRAAGGSTVMKNRDPESINALSANRGAKQKVCLVSRWLDIDFQLLLNRLNMTSSLKKVDQYLNNGVSRPPRLPVWKVMGETSVLTLMWHVFFWTIIERGSSLTTACWQQTGLQKENKRERANNNVAPRWLDKHCDFFAI